MSDKSYLSGEEREVPYFEFSTIFFHGRVHNMHDDKLHHRASVERPNATEAWVKCSCNPREPWRVPGINPSDLAIQRTFEQHLAKPRNYE